MGRYKCAYNCEYSSDSEVKFFKFPLCSPRKLKKWLSNMKWDDWTPTRFSVLCSNHFEEQCIDRTGKHVTLREDAVPTIFTSCENMQSKKAFSNQRCKKAKAPGAKAVEKETAQFPPLTSENREPDQTGEEPSGDQDQQKAEKWRIIVDERLMKIQSFPHFFHGDYCTPHTIQWAPDDDFSVSPTDCEDAEHTIEVKEPWQWLGLDIRGPMPQTLNGHKYILTVTDYYSKWVEASPMPSCLPPCVAKNISDIIAHFGYPLRILSRLPPDVVHQINLQLKDQLKVAAALLVHHQQTGTADLITPQLIDRMVSDLTEEHPADWDVYLPAKVFSLCFEEHSATKERPFSVLCVNGLEPVQSPRGVDFTNAKIQESAFVIR
uniref:THAP domain-containing protein 1 n=1 Tax=Nothobranchius pienaari TaxID=704102 RepID=A0A1A8PCU5_9TELE